MVGFEPSRKKVRTAGTRQTAVCRFAPANVPRWASANPFAPTRNKKWCFMHPFLFLFWAKYGFDTRTLRSNVGSTTSQRAPGERSPRPADVNECPAGTAHLCASRGNLSPRPILPPSFEFFNYWYKTHSLFQ